MDSLTNVNSVDKKKNEQLINNASSFWKFLDDLSANDPAAYAEFMYKHKHTQSKLIKNTKTNSNNGKLFAEFDQNIQIAQESMNGTNPKRDKYYFTPIPFMVLKTKICETKPIVETLLNVNDYRNAMKKGQKLYINFLESPYCKPLQSKSNPNNKITDKTPISDILIPIQVSKVMNEEISNDKCWRNDVIYHKSVYQRFNNNNNNTSQLFKKWIIEFALRRIEAGNSLKLIRNYKILKKKKFIGKTPPNPQWCGHKNESKNKKVQKHSITQKKTEKKSEEKRILIVKKNIEGDEKKNDKKMLGSLLKISNRNNMNNDEKKTHNIINMNESIMGRKSYLIPKYILNMDNEKKHIIKILIEMEKDNDIKDIQLNMNDTQLLLKSLHYKLHIVFPMKINENGIKAKFDKNKHCLKLKLPIQQ